MVERYDAAPGTHEELTAGQIGAFSLICGVVMIARVSVKKSDIKKIAAGNGYAIEDVICGIKSFSMLHPETLRILWELSARTSGPIIELGPYIGGSTVTMALARKNRPARIITVDKGGEYLAHPTLPSADILADLRHNLTRYSVDGDVTIVEGQIDASKTIDSVRDLLAGQKADVVFVDSDGRLDRDFPLYEPFIADGAYIVFDDYESDEASEKSAVIRPFVERGICDGHFSDLGVYQWGTWVGRYYSDVSMIGRIKRKIIGY